MAITSPIGRKSLKVRALYFSIYSLLVLGAVTMVYPFLLMISGSMKSNVDIKYFNVVPRFLYQDVWLYRKHMEGIFNEGMGSLNQVYHRDDTSFEDLELPLTAAKADACIAKAKSFQKMMDDTKDPVKTLKEKIKAFSDVMYRMVKNADTYEQLATGLNKYIALCRSLVVNDKLAEEYVEFLQASDLPYYTYTIGYIDTPSSKTMPLNLRKFKGWLRSKYGDDINAVNDALETEYINWNGVSVRQEQFIIRREKPVLTPYRKGLNEFKKTIPLGQRYYFSLEGFYRKYFVKNDYGMEVAGYNKAHNTKLESYDDLHLSRRYPKDADEKVQHDWEYFVRNIVGVQFIQVDSSAAEAYRTYLKAKHQKIGNLNKNYETDYSGFEAIPIPTKPSFSGMAATEWAAFITGWKDDATGKIHSLPLESVTLTCSDFKFQDYLKKSYKTIAAVNTAFGTKYKSFADIKLPQQDLHYSYFKKNKSAIKNEFIKRNYITVADYMLFHGRGVLNTVIYCLLAIASALIINPLAAYAMSRYKLPSTYKILLFLLCTMAFPPMVTAIPNFLMLRNLGLLNTFAALILPGLANGYAIFLLKGFFDSQPRELYESAQLDGANEWVIFWQITMSLSKPILAVIALQAFNLAYSNFMFAFVVCQDEKMWTLMVWLYQLQQKSGQAVMYASLIIAAIPTFLIFLFCQNIIMRGIVVPSEK